jgi:uncharacterized protein YbbC (DUF1343 family)
MVLTGFDILSTELPLELKGKKVALLCHSASINRNFQHIIDILAQQKEITLAEIFGPQHGLFGETQDNMIEWEGYKHQVYDIPVYSLYGENRKPTADMLHSIEAFIIDLQDIGARPYTYIWTMKNCMEACKEHDIPIWVLDRPNPISDVGVEGPVLNRDYYTFVGGAEIPLCHNMTIGEIALWLNKYENIDGKLNIIRMRGWERGMSFAKTGLPWVPPSPNMPSLSTGIVYPGTVLTEALNLSEGRGTTTPFELFGAPELNTYDLLDNLNSRKLRACEFRLHDYIPTFHKYENKYCKGVYIHITDPSAFEPVYTSLNIYDAIIETTPGYLRFNDPPYEYEYNLMPFDILTGDNIARQVLINRGNLTIEKERWAADIDSFIESFISISQY